jgi:hypothetical protein
VPLTLVEIGVDPEERQLTREDFDDLEDWLRYRWQGGLDPVDDLHQYRGVSGGGHYGALTAAVYGPTRRLYQVAWEGWGSSDHVEFKDVSQVYRAIALANCRGCVMTTRVDITWATLGLTNEILIRSHFTAFLDWMRRWLERHAGWAAYVWVFEYGGTYGLHTHMLVYVPEEEGEGFRREAKRVLAAIVKKPLLETPQSETMRIRPRGPDINTQWIRFRYMMKGIHPRLAWPDGHSPGGYKLLADRAGIKLKDGGVVLGKRVGVSRELDQESYNRWAAVNPLPDMSINPCGEYLYGNRYLNWHIEHFETLVDPRRPGIGSAD